MKSVTSKKTVYVCQSCGSEFPKWAGQCGECGAWNTLVETLGAPARSTRAGGPARIEVRRLDEVGAEDAQRTPTGLAELDRVLGGGIVPGAVILIGGDP